MHISSFISSLIFVFGIEEKVVQLLVYPSFRRVATSMLRRIFVFTSSVSQISQAERKLGVNMDSLCVQYSITAQLNN